MSKQDKQTEIRSILLNIQKIMQIGQFPAAELLTLDWLKTHPKEAELYNMLAIARMNQSKIAEANEAIISALSLAPSNGLIVLTAAKIAMERKQWDQAFNFLQRLEVLLPKFAPVHQAWALYCLATGQAEEGLKRIDRAIAFAGPESDVEYYRLIRAECLTSVGKFDEAIADYQALITQPHLKAPSLLRLAEINKFDSSQIDPATLKLLAENANVPLPVRSDLHLALGNFAERTKNHDEAFAQWAKARELLGIRVFNAEREKGILELRKSIFTKEAVADYGRHSSPSSQPVFVIGMPRSGTTLVEQMLAAHPECAGLGELDYFEPNERDFINGLRKQTVQHPVASGLREVAERYLKLIRSFPLGSKRHLVEKSPFNIVMSGFLASAFPQAKFIRLRRYPADNFISAYQNHMSPAHDYAFSQKTYAEMYMLQEAYADHLKAIAPDRVIDMKYEDLVAKPEQEAKRMVAFLGLPWSPEPLNFSDRQRSVRGLSQFQVREPLYKSSVTRWKNYEKYLSPLLDNLAEQGFEY